MFPALEGMLNGLLGKVGSAIGDLGGMALNGLSGGAVGGQPNQSGAAGNIGQMPSTSRTGGSTGAPIPTPQPAFNANGVEMRGDNGELLNVGQNSSGRSPGGMGQAPQQGQSPMIQNPTQVVSDPLMDQNSLLNGGLPVFKQFFGMG